MSLILKLFEISFHKETPKKPLKTLNDDKFNISVNLSQGKNVLNDLCYLTLLIQ